MVLRTLIPNGGHMTAGIDQITTAVAREPKSYGGRAESQIRPNAKPAESRALNGILFSHLALVALHVGLGSDLILIVIFTAISIMGVLRLTRGRIWPSDMFIVFLSFYSGTAALILKGIFFQPLQTNLVHPTYSALVLLAGFLSTMAAIFIAEMIVARIGTSRVIRTFSDSNFMRKLAVPMAIVGVGVFIIHIQIRPQLINGEVEEGAGFGGLGSLYFILILGVSMLFYQWCRSRQRRYAFLLVLAGLGMFVMSFAANTKKEFAEFLLIISLGYFTFRIRPSLLTIFLVIFAVVVMYFYVAPLIHLTRQAAADFGPLLRIALAWEVLNDHDFSVIQLAHSESRFFSGLVYSYSLESSYFYPLAGQLDRFTLILPIDRVARGTLNGYFMGLGPFLSETWDILPSMFVTKTAAVGADLMAWFYGVRGYGVFGRPVVGFAASALSVGGFTMVVFLSFIVTLPIFTFLNWSFGHLRQSPLAMSLVVFGWTLPEKSLDAFIGFGLRNALLFWLFCIILASLYRLRLGFRGSASTRKLG